MKKIYHLIAFPAEWLTGQALFHKANLREATEDDRAAFTDWKEQNQLYWYAGKAHRGVFDSKELVIEYINKYPSIHEGYYDYLCIVPMQLNVFDDWCMPEDETWFQITLEDYSYKQIERPECLEGTFGWV